MGWLSVAVVIILVALPLISRRNWVRYLSVPALLAMCLFNIDLAGAISRELIHRRRVEGRLTDDYRAGVVDMWKWSAKTRDRRILLIVAGVGILALLPARRQSRTEPAKGDRSGRSEGLPPESKG
jgi:hypothetical protein